MILFNINNNYNNLFNIKANDNKTRELIPISIENLRKIYDKYKDTDIIKIGDKIYISKDIYDKNKDILNDQFTFNQKYYSIDNDMIVNLNIEKNDIYIFNNKQYILYSKYNILYDTYLKTTHKKITKNELKKLVSLFIKHNINSNIVKTIIYKNEMYLHNDVIQKYEDLINNIHSTIVIDIDTLKDIKSVLALDQYDKYNIIDENIILINEDIYNQYLNIKYIKINDEVYNNIVYTINKNNLNIDDIKILTDSNKNKYILKQIFTEYEILKGFLNNIYSILTLEQVKEIEDIFKNNNNSLQIHKLTLNYQFYISIEYLDIYKSINKDDLIYVDISYIANIDDFIQTFQGKIIKYNNCYLINKQYENDIFPYIKHIDDEELFTPTKRSHIPLNEVNELNETRYSIVLNESNDEITNDLKNKETNETAINENNKAKDELELELELELSTKDNSVIKSKKKDSDYIPSSPLHTLRFPIETEYPKIKDSSNKNIQSLQSSQLPLSYNSEDKSKLLLFLGGIILSAGLKKSTYTNQDVDDNDHKEEGQEEINKEQQEKIEEPSNAPIESNDTNIQIVS